MILYIENPKESITITIRTNKWIWWIYKINTQNYITFTYTNNELSEREINKSIWFTIASKRIKYLGINLTKEVRDLYIENYGIGMKEIEDHTNKWKDMPSSCIGRINAAKIRFIVIPIKAPMAFFTELRQIILKFYRNTKDLE